MPTADVVQFAARIDPPARSARSCVKLSDDRLDWHLWNWTRWMDGLLVGSGYRKTASGGALGYGGTDFEEMLARKDAYVAGATDACIEDLPTAQRLTVHHVLLGSAFPDAYPAVHRLRRDPSILFAEAKVTLARTIYAKGIV